MVLSHARLHADMMAAMRLHTPNLGLYPIFLEDTRLNADMIAAVRRHTPNEETLRRTRLPMTCAISPLSPTFPPSSPPCPRRPIPSRSFRSRARSSGRPRPHRAIGS